MLSVFCKSFYEPKNPFTIEIIESTNSEIIRTNIKTKTNENLLGSPAIACIGIHIKRICGTDEAKIAILLHWLPRISIITAKQRVSSERNDMRGYQNPPIPHNCTSQKTNNGYILFCRVRLPKSHLLWCWVSAGANRSITREQKV